MRTLATAATFVAALGLVGSAGVAAEKIDLRTIDGVQAVKGEWRYADVKIVEVDGTGPDKKPVKTYNIEPKAFGADFDDSGWEVLDPTTLGKARSTGQVCFCWYRIKVTLPEGAAGKTVEFVTTVDDYGEVWVDGKLPRTGRPERRVDRRRVQRPEPRRAARRPGRQDVPDRCLRHQRPDLGRPRQLDLPPRHLP